MNKEQCDVIESLEKAIELLEIHDHWKKEVRILIEILGAVRKSEGQI